MDEKYEEMEEKKVNYKVRYRGDDQLEIKKGKIYTCVAEWYDEDGKLDTLSVIDDTKEDYLYEPILFEKVD